MARARLNEVVWRVVGTSGQLNARDDVSATIKVRGGGAATVYSAETGVGTTANPQTPVNGELAGWLDQGSYDIELRVAGVLVRTASFEGLSGAGGGGRELDRLEMTTSFATTSNVADVTALTGLVVPASDRPIMVELWATQQVNSVAAQWSQAFIQQSTTKLAWGPLFRSVGASDAIGVCIKARMAASASPRTVKATFGRTAFSSSGTASLFGDVTSPAYLNATEM